MGTQANRQPAAPWSPSNNRSKVSNGKKLFAGALADGRRVYALKQKAKAIDSGEAPCIAATDDVAPKPAPSPVADTPREVAPTPAPPLPANVLDMKAARAPERRRATDTTAAPLPAPVSADQNTKTSTDLFYEWSASGGSERVTDWSPPPTWRGW
jgi:hypothetical protein